MDTQEISSMDPRGDARDRRPLEDLRADIAKLKDPHIRDLGTDGLARVEEAAIRMYERYTGLQAKFDAKGFSQELYGEVNVLEKEFRAWQGRIRARGTTEIDEYGRSKNPTDIFLALLANKITGLSGRCQIAEIRAKRAAA